MKKMMMILVAVAAIGFTSCQKGANEDNKAQTEQTDSAKAAEKTGDVAAQDANKTDDAATTDAKADVKADAKADVKAEEKTDK